MYEKFFGFKERPFQLVPNPAYLFLSKGHEEALAHLTYAVSQGDGFVKITGEVGTGKTTLCRVFLENLDDRTEAAYIFNPMLDAVQLLKAINDEFGISSEADTTKPLIDTLNRFLMEKKRQGMRIIVVIDEAQNLGRDVLEQLRLLSNLETNTSKLLQIILVGQPELREKLDAHELRQLNQRITLSCHLTPLNLRETGDYIQHRVRIASQKTGVRFTRSAFRAIYNYSGGTPRLINIVCDRAMLTAYGLNKHKITGYVARDAIRELAAGKGDVKAYGLYRSKGIILALVLLCAILAVLYYPRSFNAHNVSDAPVSQTASAVTKKEKQPEPAKAPQSEMLPAEESELAAITPADGTTARSEAPEPSAISLPSTPPTPDTDLPDMSETKGEPPDLSSRNPSTKPVKITHDLESFLNNMAKPSSRRTAFRAVLTPWQVYPLIKKTLDVLEEDQAFFRLAARQNAFSLHRVEGDLNLVSQLNLPAILEIHPPNSTETGYLALTRMTLNEITLMNGETVIGVPPEKLYAYWTGVAYIPWRDFLGITGTVPRNAPADSVITLKMVLQDIGFSSLEVTPAYDEATRQAVKQLQAKHGLKVDGSVGPMTKIVLYNELKSLTIPHVLTRTETASHGEAEH